MKYEVSFRRNCVLADDDMKCVVNGDGTVQIEDCVIIGKKAFQKMTESSSVG